MLSFGRLDGAIIFLAPHYDDVVLSCGGTVALLADGGHDPEMVTVFAGETTNHATSDFARAKQARWGVASIDEIIPLRQEEDRAAAAVLGCRTRWLGFPDAIYRGQRYESDRSLYDTPHDDELALAPLIAAEISSLCSAPREPDSRGTSGEIERATVFVPLAAGNHVDHQLTFQAGCHLAAQGAHVWVYEDCPYAIHTPAGVTERLETVRHALGSPVLVPVRMSIERRIAAIRAYGTQVPVIFRFTDDYAGAIRAFAQQLAVAGGLAQAGEVERFWPVR